VAARLGLGTFEAAFGGSVLLYFCEFAGFDCGTAGFDVLQLSTILRLSMVLASHIGSDLQLSQVHLGGSLHMVFNTSRFRLQTGDYFSCWRYDCQTCKVLRSCPSSGHANHTPRFSLPIHASRPS